MKVIVVLVGVLCPMLLAAQSFRVKGVVMDTAAEKKLHNVVISFLKQSDSTLVSFVRTDTDGRFEDSLPSGDFIVLVSSPEFADYVTTIHTSGDAIMDMQTIPLLTKAMLLKEIIVTQQAIRIKGDTTEYLADSFRVRPNATVEDLLKELPGIQVDNTGKITAQGQTVQKILVDGEEFFSDDPTIATQNLRAEDVKKVQVFDKKSDEANFTGVDDGQSTKTINLELKDDAKNGYFGKLSAAGLDRFYNLQAMINAFRDKRKLSAFAITSSTSQTGFDVQEGDTYGFSPGTIEVNEGAGALIISTSSEELGSGNFSGSGLPKSIKAGVHYSNKWDEDQIGLNTNYLLNDLKVRSVSSILIQNILEDDVYYTDTKTRANSDQLKNNVSGTVDLNIDSSSSLKIDFNGAIGKNDFRNSYESENLTDQQKTINNSLRNTQSQIRYGNESFTALYRKRFKESGKSLSVRFSQGYNESNKDGLLLNKSNYFDIVNDILIKKDTIDQRKTADEKILSFSTGLTYTHPLSQISFLVFNYSFSHKNNLSERLSFDRGLTNNHDLLNDEFSNKFSFVYNIHRGGVNYRYAKGKTNLSAGGSISTTDFQQHDYFMDTSGRRNYLNFYPQLNLTYRFSAFRNIRVSYSGQTIQPTINQIQPMKNNNDPMNVVIGNPDLKQAFKSDLEVFFTDVKMMSDRYMMAGINASLTNNEINQSYLFDNLGVNTSKFVNTDGNYFINIATMINSKIPNTTWRIGYGPLAQIIRYTNYVNGFKSITHTTKFRLRLTMQGRVKNKLAVQFAAMPGYNTSRSNISKVSNKNYWDANITTDVTYQLPLKFEIGTDVLADLRQKITSFDVNNSLISWNAYLEKRFLKDGTLALRASIFDILDQDKGYSRYQLATGLYEMRSLTWGQYGLISLTYNFAKKGGKTSANNKDAIHF